MRSGVVKAPVTGRNNKIYEHGDTVTEKNFPPGNFDLLIARGFITEGEAKVESVENTVAVAMSAPAEEKKSKKAKK